MPTANIRDLSKREREVLYVVYELERATVLQIQNAIEGDISYNAVRRVLDSLVAKELVVTAQEGKRYLFSPVRSRTEQGTKLLKEVLKTFFDESAALGFASLLRSKDPRLQELEVDNLRALLSEPKQLPDQDND